jgi:hypothetical protein
MTTTDTDFVSIERISQSILLLRGYRVILDKDLATIYGVQPRALNQAVRRNSDRFPGDFMFQLSREDIATLRSQSATPNTAGRGQHGKYTPYAFTEHGAIQAANCINSSRAVQMSIHVVRAFVQLRAVLASNKELAEKLTQLERLVDSHDTMIVDIMKTIRQLTDVPQTRAIGFVLPDKEQR